MGIFLFAEPRKKIGVLCFLLYCCVLYAQNTDEPLNQAAGTEQSASASQPLAGIWENNERFVRFEYSSPEKGGVLRSRIVLKPFYAYYYDGIYEPGSYTDGMPLAVVNGGIYPEFWTSHKAAGGTFWKPENNRSDFTIETVEIARELTAYYTSDDLKTVYKIRYWRTKADFTEEKAELRIPDYPPEDFEETILIDKYIKIDGTVYTCATGRRAYVRNPEKLVSLPQTVHIGDILVFGDPLLKRSDITDLETEIAAHNSIVYPPRNGRVDFTEPSIYRKLESMGQDDFYNIRSRGGKKY